MEQRKLCDSTVIEEDLGSDPMTIREASLNQKRAGYDWWGEVIRQLKFCIELDPSNAIYHKDIAEMLQDEYYIECDFEEALDHYEQALKLSPDNIYTYWEVIELKTNDHFGGKFFEQAQGYLNYIVGLDPENCNHWFLKGCQELKMEKWEQAIQSFEWANQLAYSGKFGKDTTGSFVFKNCQ